MRSHLHFRRSATYAVTMTTAERPIRTLKDIARLAGVNPGTVSRALANSPLVNEQTRQRIAAIAAEHGFRPNLMARRLRTQRTVQKLLRELQRQINQLFGNAAVQLVDRFAHGLHQRGHLLGVFLALATTYQAGELREADRVLPSLLAVDPGELLRRVR